MPHPTRADLEIAAAKFFGSLRAEIDQREPLDLNHLHEEVSFNVEESKKRVSALEAQLSANQFDGQVSALASDLLARLQQNLDSIGVTERKTALQLSARLEREQLCYLMHRLLHPADEYVEHDPILRVREKIFTNPSGSNGLSPLPAGRTLAFAADEYLQQKKNEGVKGNHVDELSRALGWLKERFGEATHLDVITKVQMAQFRTDLCRRNANLQGSKVPFEEALTDKPEQQITSDTARRYWQSVQAFFARAHESAWASSDPAVGIKIHAKKGQQRNSPEPFSKAELESLFKTPLYAGYLSPSRPKSPGSCVIRDGHWWSGILLLFTGLRAAELSQLLPEDFNFEADIPHLKIRAENASGAKVKSVKSASSIRDIPLAPALVELGIRQFVQRRAKSSPTARVFREFRLGTNGRNSDGLTKFWGPYLRTFNLWKPGRSTHVWRHTVVACLREHEVAEDDQMAYVGHKNQTVTGGYGAKAGFPMARKLKTAESLDFGFDVVKAVGGPFDAKRH